MRLQIKLIPATAWCVPLLAISLLALPAVGQGLGMPPSGSPAPTAAPPAAANNNAAAAPRPAAAPAATPPSLQPVPTTGRTAAPSSGGGQLPQESGQEYRQYDLRPYTGYLTKHDRPEQAIIDWVLRETGTDAWFSEPFGFMNANRDSLAVYHTPEMHAVVADVVDRFVAGTTDPQVFSLRVMTVGNPNWRSRVHPLMQHVTVQSPGVQAWLLTKENAAIVVSMLRQRTDTREVQAVDVVTYNGQTEKLASTRGRNFVRNIRPAVNPLAWPPYEPETGEVQEGYQLELSPLLSQDGLAIDCVIQANIDQVDKLLPVDLDLPLPSGQTHRARIEVPQVVSWRLHERFRWPSDMVLLLSCGVVASPDRPQSSVPLLNLNMLTGQTAGRADALMFVEFRGNATSNLIRAPQVADLPRTSTAAGRRY
ncbi:hypothetical protein [Roseimaritima ulvae]|uniref:Uncharacterized protein n=1 Tax=Roseimaritima ulvae TaxID=980254 RepID=A0A5B9QZK7_9BACT|nr:hypothetical protein [Roseimaritima ulvae]QEG43522.1 hypothetical protein UC8_55730 [Roseimaritima ulvae]